MKKFLSVVLAIVLLSGFCGCKKDNHSQASGQTLSTANISSSVTSTARTAPDYTNFNCRKASEITWQDIKIKRSGIATKLRLSLPSDWVVSADDKDGYDITRAGKKIGTLSLKEPADPENFFEFDIVSNLSGGVELHRYRQVNWYTQGSKDIFSRIFKFVCGPGNESFTAYLTVDYTELNDTAAERLFDNSKAVVDNNFKSVYNLNGSKEILILGNSFINTSQIGAFLNDMLRGTGYTATAYSRGYAEVSTYANDSYLCTEIKNGKYCYVFQCGFYSDSAVSDFKTMKNTCDASGTPIVIFPAHNENQSSINAAKIQFNSIPLLDWKNEINNLVESGVEYWDFCIDDSHKHSTTLAGYVGAHMIYTVLFGKIPPEIKTSPLSMTQVRAKLGDYVNKGGMYAPFSGKEYELK